MQSSNDDPLNSLRAAIDTLSDARLAAEDSLENRPGLVDALEALADLQRQEGDFDKAESSYREAIETAILSAAPLAQLARLRSSLATLYDFNQLEEQAIPLYEQAIEDYEKSEPPNPAEAAQLRNNLAWIYKQIKRNPLAEQHYLMALETLERIHGRNDERVAAVFNNLGSLYHTAGYPEQAKEMHLEAMEIRMKVFGGDHPEVAQSHSNLAVACYDLEDIEGMKDNYEKSLDILESHLAEHAQSYQDNAADYIAVLESLDETRQAQAVQKRVDKALKRA
jgi:tetratricopeptide (TPR) repeat protein